MERGVCEFCHHPVLSTQTAAFPVRGWEVERSGGGAHHIAGREREPNRIAHRRCMEHHVNLGAQESLLGDPV